MSLDTFEIEIDGSPVDAVLHGNLHDIRVSRSLGVSSHAEFRFIDTDDVSTIAVGSGLEVYIVQDATASSVFSGTIVSIGLEISGRLGRSIRVEALDDSRKLGHTIAVDSTMDSTIADTISSIANDAGLAPDVTVDADALAHVQHVGTPHQFLDLLAATYGYQWQVDGNTLKVWKRDTTQGAVVTISHGVDLIGFSARASLAEQPRDVKVRGWDPATKEAIVGEAMLSDAEGKAMASIGAGNALQSIETAATAQTHRPEVESVTHAEAIAEGLARKLASRRVTGRAATLANPAIVPGIMIEFLDLGTEWSGSYFVTAVEHVMGDRQALTTHIQFGPHDPTTLVDLLGGPAISTMDRHSMGVSIGKVTQVVDEDGWGRVKVNIPALGDDHETPWARVVSAGAGNARGLLAVPEVEDEVAVAFENGNLQRPYVLGGLWNGVDLLPDHGDLVVDGAIASRSFTSRVGNKIVLADVGDDTDHVLISSRDDQSKVIIGADKIDVITESLPITVDNSQATLVLADDGAVTLTAAAAITIDAGTNDITLTGNNITLTASGDVTAESTGGAANLTGSTGVNVEASGNAVVKGAMVQIN